MVRGLNVLLILIYLCFVFFFFDKENEAFINVASRHAPDSDFFSFDVQIWQAFDNFNLVYAILPFLKKNHVFNGKKAKEFIENA